MSQLCDAEDHNQEAPNKQNLLCNYRSALEVIREQNSTMVQLKPPNIRFVQNNPEIPETGNIIIVQDLSSDMNRVRPKGSKLFKVKTFSYTVLAELENGPGDALHHDEGQDDGLRHQGRQAHLRADRG